MFRGGWPAFCSIQGHRPYDCLLDLSFEVFRHPLITQDAGGFVLFSHAVLIRERTSGSVSPSRDQGPEVFGWSSLTPARRSGSIPESEEHMLK